MALTNQKLWTKIESFNLDHEKAELSFSKRLARDKSWPHQYSCKVIDEYKKFIYLSCVSKTPVTPSHEIDQAWHLHLTYTHNYWDLFCNQTLQKNIHHNPTAGGRKEREKYKRQYQYTLDLYQKEFGYPAPPDIWPSSKIRFSDPMYERTINLKEYWVIPKPKELLARLNLFLVFTPILIIAACTETNETYPVKILYATTYVITALLYNRLRQGGYLLPFTYLGATVWVAQDIYATIDKVEPWMVWLGAWLLAALLGKTKGKWGDSGCSGCGGCGD